MTALEIAAAPDERPKAPLAAESDDARRVGLRLALAFAGGSLVLSCVVARGDGVYGPAVADASAALGAIVLAAPIVIRAARNVRDGTLDLDELIALAIIAAFAFEDYVTAGAVAFFATLGELVERRTALGARAAIESLVRLTPTRANVVSPDGTESEVEATRLRPGDIVRVRPGDYVPADGTIRAGRSTLDEKSITGESQPVDKGPQDAVFAGTTNVTGSLDLVVSRAGEDTTLGRVKELILAAERARPPVARLDRPHGRELPALRPHRRGDHPLLHARPEPLRRGARRRVPDGARPRRRRRPWSRRSRARLASGSSSRMRATSRSRASSRRSSSTRRARSRRGFSP